MARYRVKDETDMRWNRIRRHLTRELDTQIQNTREEVLNTILSDAWEKYAKALEAGEKLEVENHYTLFVDQVVRQQLGPLVESKASESAEAPVADPADAFAKFRQSIFRR